MVKEKHEKSVTAINSIATCLYMCRGRYKILGTKLMPKVYHENDTLSSVILAYVFLIIIKKVKA